MNILLIHGLGRTPLSMSGLGKTLTEAGHTVEFFGYTTLLESFDDIVKRLRDHILALSHAADSASKANTPYGIVTHSMGAVLLRAALTKISCPLPAQVVMLAPPNQSPRMARIATHFPPFLWFAGQSGRNLASSEFYAKLPPLNCPYTLITGNIGLTGALSPFGSETNDVIVSAEESKMHPHDRVIEVPALHSFIMNNKTAQTKAVKAFSYF
ncbi:MAG: esterase/lipase family protein [Phormidesmis sp.]